MNIKSNTYLILIIQFGNTRVFLILVNRLISKMMKSQIKIVDTVICQNAKHLTKSFYFCQNCAVSNQPLRKIFYCKQCDMTAHMVQHKSHTQKYSFQDAKFTEKLQQFLSFLRTVFNNKTTSFSQMAGATKSKEKYSVVQEALKQFFANQKQFVIFIKDNFTLRVLNNPQPRRFMIKCKFWQFKGQRKQNIERLTIVMGELIMASLMEDPCLKKLCSNGPEIVSNDFVLNIPQVNDEINIQNEIKKANECSQVYTRQLDMVNFLIEMYSSFSISQCLSTLDYCRQLIRKYPNEVILYFSEIRLLELIPQGTEKISEVLNQITQIDKSFPSQAISHYFKAVAQWRIVDRNSLYQPQIARKLFYQPKNQQYYTINNVDIFISELSKAIQIQENQGYFAARGVGYLISGEIEKAESDLSKAIKITNNHHSVINNFLYSQIKQNKVRDQVIIEQLSNKSRQYIVNAAKYFKKSKKFQKVAQCCQALLDRQPKNQLIEVQLFKALIRGQNLTQDKLDNAKEVLEGMSKNTNQSYARYDKLRTKLAVSKGRLYYQQQKLEEAQAIFEQIGRQVKISGTIYYNQAVINYQSQNYEQAQQAINKAIELKQKPKYRILKAYICCMIKDFEQAIEQFRFFQCNTVELNNLKQFIQQQ